MLILRFCRRPNVAEVYNTAGRLSRYCKLSYIPVTVLMTGRRAGRPPNRGSVPGKVSEAFPRGVRRPGCKADHSPPSSARLRMRGVTPRMSHMPLWRLQDSLLLPRLVLPSP